MTLLGSFGALSLKLSIDKESNIMQSALCPLFYLGAGLYFLSALLNIYVLKYLQYSVVLPLTSITYIWTMIFSYIYLKERITVYKIVGILLIILGVIFIAFS